MREKPSGEIDPKKWRPFLRLGKYVSEDFLKLAEEWLFLVREHGISKIATRPTSEEEFLVFLAHVHDGWKEAQKRIAVFLTDALTRFGAAQASDKQHHRSKDKEGQKQARAMSKRLRLEVAIARRMLDVILWTIVEGDQSTLRRLHVDGGEHSLTPANIADAMKAADSFNQDPQVMALSTDILSFVHVGDLIVANRSKQSISFVELKSGERNAKISGAAQFAVRSQCEYFEGMTVAGYDDTDRKHYERVKRQVVRNETIVETIRMRAGPTQIPGTRS